MYQPKIGLLRMIRLVVIITTCLSLACFQCTGSELAPIDEYSLNNPLTVTNTNVKLQYNRRLISCDDLDYENTEDDYSPSTLVENGHRISNADFCPEQSYYDRVAVAPIVLTSLYLLMFVSFACGMLSRCCSEWCQCRSDSSSSSFRAERLWNTVAFYAFSLIALAFSLLILLSNFRLNNGLKTISGATGDLEDVFRDVRTESRRLESYGSSLSSSFSSAKSSCDGASSSLLDEVDESVSEYNDAVEEVLDRVEPAIDALRDLNSGLDLYSGFYRQLAIYLIFSLTVAYVLFMITAKMVESMCTMQLLISVGLFIFFCYTALLLPFTAGASVSGDFCMDPSLSAVNMAPKSDAVQEDAIYFSTCSGNSTYASYLDSSRANVQSLNASLTAMLTSCPGDSNVESMQDTVESVDDVLDNIDELIECEPIQDEWFTLFNDGFCGDFYDGVFYLWLGILLAGFFLLMLAITGSFSYQFFDAIDIPIITAKKKKRGGTVAPGAAGDSDEEEADEEDSPYQQGDSQQQPASKKHHKKKPQPQKQQQQRADFIDDDEFDEADYEEADSSQVDIDAHIDNREADEAVDRKKNKRR